MLMNIVRVRNSSKLTLHCQLISRASPVVLDYNREVHNAPIYEISGKLNRYSEAE